MNRPSISRRQIFGGVARESFGKLYVEIEVRANEDANNIKLPSRPSCDAVSARFQLIPIY